jgi:hypothetical protein
MEHIAHNCGGAHSESKMEHQRRIDRTDRVSGPTRIINDWCAEKRRPEGRKRRIHAGL